jgi:hypothetical protein
MNASFYLMAGAILAIASPWAARAQDATTPPTTIEQRLAALESAVAKLDTQLALEISRPSAAGGGSPIALESRVMSLERTVERLVTDVQRAERLAESASRAASDAQRDAMRAEQAARDAAMRSR